MPGPLRWGISVALAVGVPVLLAAIVPRLGPGPHAPVRIELALQPLGSGVAAGRASGSGTGHGGTAAGGTAAGGTAAGGTGPHAPPGAMQANAESKAAQSPRTEPRPAAVEAAPPPATWAAQSIAPPIASRSAPKVANPLSVASAHATAPASARTSVPDPAAPDMAAPASSAPAAAPETPVPARAEDNPARGVVASESARTPNLAPDAAAAQGSAAPGSGGTDGAAGTGAAAGSVGPDSLDAGFGLAEAVRLEYPAAALAQGQGGQARIEVEIEPNGSVARVSILEETGDWEFGAAAQRAYASARFTPPRLGGRPVRVVLRKTIEFEP